MDMFILPEVLAGISFKVISTDSKVVAARGLSNTDKFEFQLKETSGMYIVLVEADHPVHIAKTLILWYIPKLTPP